MEHPGAPGTARLLEPLGDVTLVHFDAAEGGSLVAKVAPDSQLAPGAPLRFRFLPEQCHLFDLASGQRRARYLLKSDAKSEAPGATPLILVVRLPVPTLPWQLAGSVALPPWQRRPRQGNLRPRNGPVSALQPEVNRC